MVAGSPAARTVRRVTVEVWAALIASVAVGLTALTARACGWKVRGGKLTRPRGRHAADPAAPRRSSRGAKAPSVDVEVVPDVELALSPRTGRLSSGGRPVPEGTAVGAAPVPRAPTTGSAAGASGPAVESLPSTPWLLASIELDDRRRATMLAASWTKKDPEALAAQGEADPTSALAAFTLAGWLGRLSGDPRAGRWVYQAFLTGESPVTDRLLEPYRDQLQSSATFDLWEIREDVACTREGLAVTVAADEVACGDFDAAYGALLDAEPSARVAALRALVAVELEWWPRARVAARHEGAGPRWQPWLDLAAGTAQGRLGLLDEAARSLSLAAAAMSEPGWNAGTVGLNRAQLERARVRAALGDSGGAWQDLTDVLGRNPTFPGAGDALKGL